MEWILCSDRMPKMSFSYSTDEGYDVYESELVLVTTEWAGSKAYFVQIANVYSEVVTDKELYEEIVGGEPEDPVWFSRDRDEVDAIPVIAWMPLPEPYEEVAE